MKKYLIPIIILSIVVAGLLFFTTSNSPQAVIPTSTLTETYKNPYFFSFQHASTTHIEESLTEQGGTIMVNGVQGDFQVYISPYDEDSSTITSDRLMKDIPDLKMKDNKPIVIGADASGLSFVSEDTQGMETWEVWFARKGFLYQVSALSESKSFLEETLKTWKIEE